MHGEQHFFGMWKEGKSSCVHSWNYKKCYNVNNNNAIILIAIGYVLISVGLVGFSLYNIYKYINVG